MKLSDIQHYRNNKYTLDSDLRIMTDVISFSAESEKMRLFVDGTLELYKGYQWDGATCAPDFKFVIIPSAVHDAFYRLIRERKLPGRCKAEADRTFYALINNSLDFSVRKGFFGFLDFPKIISNSMIAKSYYYGVRLFGFIGLRR